MLQPQAIYSTDSLIFLTLKNKNASIINRTEQQEFTESINTADFVYFS